MFLKFEFRNDRWRNFGAVGVENPPVVAYTTAFCYRSRPRIRRGRRLSDSEDVVILACVFLTQYQCVCVWQTDRQADRQTFYCSYCNAVHSKTCWSVVWQLDNCRQYSAVMTVCSAAARLAPIALSTGPRMYVSSTQLIHSIIHSFIYVRQIS